MENSFGNKAAKGAIWASIDRFGYMAGQFVVNLVLARLLIPADFGIIGMLTIFLAVSQTLLDGGFGSAIIQKKQPTEKDYSTILIWNISFSLFLYLILFCASGLIADFYKMPQLSAVLKVMAISLVLNGIFAIQKTRLQKNLEFRKIAIINLLSYFLSAIIAIALAYHGWGVWSLVFMQLIYCALTVVISTLVTKWIPLFSFSINSLKELFSFGGFILAANILQTICQNLQGLIIGKRFSATQMGLYTQAYKLDQITSYSIPQIIVQVMFPVYSSLQDNLKRLNEVVLMNLRVVALAVFPILTCLILVANPLISFLYGDKWLAAVPYFKILCIGGFFTCLQNINFYAVASVGKSKVLFKWSFYKWGFLLTAMLMGMYFGMKGILWGIVASNINIFIVNAFLASKHTGLSVWMQLKSIAPILFLSVATLGIAFLIVNISNSYIIGGISFFSLFIVFSILFKIKALREAKDIFKRIINRK